MPKIKRAIPMLVLFSMILLVFIIFQGNQSAKMSHKEEYAQISSDLNECYKSSDFDKCQSIIVSDYSKAHGINKLIAAVRFVRQSNPAVENNCHQLMHEVGSEVYKSVKDISRALDICPNDCIYGCSHFAIASFLQTDAVDGHVTANEIRRKATVLCDKYEGKQYANCRHGLGHAAMIAMDYDIDRGLGLCSLSSKGKASRLDCNQGVYMESMSSRNRKFIFDPEKPNAFCGSYDEDNQGACYPYLAYHWIHHYGLERSMGMCESLQFISAKKGCIGGLGTMAYHTILPLENAVHKCMGLALYSSKQHCVLSLTSASMNQYDDGDEAMRVCRLVTDPGIHSECLELIAERRSPSK